MSNHFSIEREQSELQEAVKLALDYAASKGASEAECAISRQQGLSVTTRLDDVETLEFNKDGALGISVYSGQRKGSASTADLSPEAIKQAVDAACHISRHTSEDPCAGPADKELLATEIPDLDLYHPASQEPDYAIEQALQCERAALAHDERITNSDGATYNSHIGVRVYGNSHGFLAGYPSSRHSLSCVLIGTQDEMMQRDYSYTVARNVAGLWTPEKVGQDAARRTVSRLGARKIDTCSVPVVFSPEAASGLFGHFVGAISGGNLYRKSSFLLDKLGEQVFSKHVSISEKPHLRQALASSPFDSEGVHTCDREIVADGVLNTYLLTSYSARKLKMSSTGHAGGIHNWFVSTTGQSQAQLLKEMGTGLLVTELMGQGVNLVTGDYSRGAAGFWVENGEIQFPVQEITIAGKLDEMFQQILAIGNDVDERSSVRTGSILIEQMKVAGQ